MITRRRSMFLLGGSVAVLSVAAARGATPPGGDGQDDPIFNMPYIDIDEWRDSPVRHRYIHGGFKRTDARFSFYFPPKETYQGRFFQHVTPIPASENLAQHPDKTDDKIGFAIASGAYFIETNEGGIGAIGMPGSSVDPTIAGYRVNAAAAEFSRRVAVEMYGTHRVFGYAYGGSGGAFRTIAGFETTTGIWDGVVPYVIGSPMAIPNMFTVRLHAMRVLKDKLPAIGDAMDAGGSGEPYAGLDEEERAALLEATRMGFPPRTWFAYRTLGMGPFAILMDAVLKQDPDYVGDFWTVPGYLGADPTPSLLNARIRCKTTVKKIVMPEEAKALGLPMPPALPSPGDVHAWKGLTGEPPKIPVALQLADSPAGDLTGAYLVIENGTAAGSQILLGGLIGDVAMIGFGSDNARILLQIREGDAVRIDNSAYLAIQTYHRHQVPTRDYGVWDQFRAPDGTPLYPQRAKLIGPEFAYAAGGALQSGHFGGKMIVVASLMDEDALPWQADWYRTNVEEAHGAKLNDHFRLWFTDRAMHIDTTDVPDKTQVVSYLGALHQALRDLSAWVEKGTAPPASTNYKVVDGQVEVPASAVERRGIQPVVSLLANGASRAQAIAGEPVEFVARVELPPHTGAVTAAEWDFSGKGDYPVKAQLKNTRALHLTCKATHRFTTPGTHFVAFRATSQREGDADTPYARIENLARVRVVVV